MFFRLEKPGFFAYEISGHEGDKHQEEDADSDVPAAFGREPRSRKIFVPVCKHCLILYCSYYFRWSTAKAKSPAA